MAAKNRLQRFIELHEQARAASVGAAFELHESFLELAYIVAEELNAKRDKKKNDLERVLGGYMPSKKEILWMRSHDCGICGLEIKNINEATIDHIKPKSKGGTNDIRNLQLAHPECNVRKGNVYDEDQEDVVASSPFFQYAWTKRYVRFMLEESNLIEGVLGKEAVDEAYMAWKWLIGHSELTADNIKKCHALLMRNRDLEKAYKGAWRPVPVTIGGKLKSEPPIVIDSLIRDWCEDIKKSTTQEQVQADHVRFEGIHPFVDGNGRMGRILMNWQLAKLRLPMCVILNARKQEYYKWFQG